MHFRDQVIHLSTFLQEQTLVLHMRQYVVSCKYIIVAD